MRLLLSPAIDVTLELDPNAGAVCLAPGELDLMILNLVLDARSRLGEVGPARDPQRAAGRARRGNGRDHRRGSAARRLAGLLRRRSTQFGLATVGLITRDAGGEVEFLPGPGGGCEVRIRLPARREPAGRPSRPYGSGRGQVHHEHALFRFARAEREASALCAHDQLGDQELDRVLRAARARWLRPPTGRGSAAARAPSARSTRRPRGAARRCRDRRAPARSRAPCRTAPRTRAAAAPASASAVGRLESSSLSTRWWRSRNASRRSSSRLPIISDTSTLSRRGASSEASCSSRASSRESGRRPRAPSPGSARGSPGSSKRSGSSSAKVRIVASGLRTWWISALASRRRPGSSSRIRRGGSSDSRRVDGGRADDRRGRTALPSRGEAARRPGSRPPRLRRRAGASPRPRRRAARAPSPRAGDRRCRADRAPSRRATAPRRPRARAGCPATGTRAGTRAHSRRSGAALRGARAPTPRPASSAIGSIRSLRSRSGGSRISIVPSARASGARARAPVVSRLASQRSVGARTPGGGPPSSQVASSRCARGVSAPTSSSQTDDSARADARDRREQRALDLAHAGARRCTGCARARRRRCRRSGAGSAPACRGPCPARRARARVRSARCGSSARSSSGSSRSAS